MAEWVGMSLDAMKQALAALEQYTNVVTSSHDPNSWVTVADGGKPAREAITTLRAAIEQAQEPAAWRWGYRSVTNGEMDWRGYVEKVEHPNLRSPDVIVQPLYTAPRQWQGLTDEEIDALEIDENGLPNSHLEFARAIEAKLKERNT